MKLSLLIVALAAPAAVIAQPAFDWRTGPATAGSWSYRALPTGSEAVFTDARATRRFLVKCSRASRRVTLSYTSATTAPSMQVTTSENSRVLPATFDAQGFQIASDLGAQDPLLDAIAFSSGRFAISVPGNATIVLQAWPEIARSIEDCRS